MFAFGISEALARWSFSRQVVPTAFLVASLICMSAVQGKTPDSKQIQSLATQAQASTTEADKLKLLNQLLEIDSTEAAEQVVKIIRSDEFVLSNAPLRSDDVFSTPSPAMGDPLVTLLKESIDKRLPCRRLVAQLLGKMLRRDAAPIIAASLPGEARTGSSDVTVAYCAALGKLKDDQTVSALSGILELQETADGQKAQAACTALAVIQTPAALDALSKRIFASPASLYAINAFENVPASLALPALIKAVTNRHVDPSDTATPADAIRLKQFKTLLDMIKSKALELKSASSPPLLAWSPSPYPDGRGDVVYSAQRAKLASDLQAWWRVNAPSAKDPDKIADGAQPDVKAHVDDLIKQLTKAKTDPNASHMSQVLSELLSIDDPYAARQFIAALKSDAKGFSMGLPTTAGKAFVIAPAYTNVSLQLLQDAQAAIRENHNDGYALRTVAVNLLSKIGGPRAGAAITGLINSELSRPHKKAILYELGAWCSAVGHCKYDKGVATIQRALQFDAAPNDCPAAAIGALVEIGTPDAFNVVGHLLVVTDHHSQAITALARTENPLAISALIDALSARAKPVEGESKDELLQRQEKLRGDVYKLLVKKTGQAQFGSDQAAWRKWWSSNQQSAAPTSRPVPASNR